MGNNSERYLPIYLLIVSLFSIYGEGHWVAYDDNPPYHASKPGWVINSSIYSPKVFFFSLCIICSRYLFSSTVEQSRLVIVHIWCVKKPSPIPTKLASWTFCVNKRVLVFEASRPVLVTCRCLDLYFTHCPSCLTKMKTGHSLESASWKL